MANCIDLEKSKTFKGKYNSDTDCFELYTDYPYIPMRTKIKDFTGGICWNCEVKKVLYIKEKNCYFIQYIVL